ncbi:MAG: alpha-ketoacid dehydrogenase subunit alpha/beta [Bacteroidales bacterium]
MTKKGTAGQDFIRSVLEDYRTAYLSRQMSILGRREVLTGKAKFGIFGDGKEIPQLAMARVFQPGDWRAGYYRDQTFMLAAGLMKPTEFFSQLYGDTDQKYNPQTAGRLMNNHFASATVDEKGNWLNLTQQKNVSADISPTAGHMPRLLGLALASKLLRENRELQESEKSGLFTVSGNEVAFGTIGDASTSEGYFFEVLNAAGVLQVPLAMSVWDDGYGISVPREYQTIKSSISDALEGFRAKGKAKGFKIYKVKGWDYPALLEAYREGIELCRQKHVPVLFHIIELTQPQGHSTSGSHERYKSKERLQWESEYDGLKKMREWILEQKFAQPDELDDIEKEAVAAAKAARKEAWEHFMGPLKQKQHDFIRMVDVTTCNCAKTEKIEAIKRDLKMVGEPIRKDIISSARKILRLICDQCSNPKNSLKKNVSAWLAEELKDGKEAYSSHLYSNTERSVLKIKEEPVRYGKQPEWVPGRVILRDNFDKLFSQYPELVVFGEDVGRIGGVNQTYEGLQAKYGEHRIFDTGIREASIVGQGLGLAMRGFRPIAEVQYFDYLLYALQVMSDDVATLRYRTRGRQIAPLIISTRGHRLEGIWHAGSPLSMVINSIRGVHVCVPRNMTQAAGMYNTLLASDEPALVIEPLNAYRLREKKPANPGEFRVPLGKPEILREGFDVTVVTYGSCVRIAEDAIKQLTEYSISCELIDVQTLIPFDLNHVIGKSLAKTNKIVFFDEDVPGGATSYMMQKVLEEQNGYYSLDEVPVTLTAREHRAAYSTDGDYFSNPNAEDLFETVYNLMHRYNPTKYPKIF